MPRLPDITTNKVFKFPEDIRKDIDRLIVDQGWGAISIKKYLLATYPNAFLNEASLPTIPTFHKYVQWRMEHPYELTQHIYNPETNTNPKIFKDKKVNNTVVNDLKKTEAQSLADISRDLHDELSTPTPDVDQPEATYVPPQIPQPLGNQNPNIVNETPNPAGDEQDKLLTVNLESGKDTLDVIKEKIRQRITLLEHQQLLRHDKNTEQTIQKYYDALRQLVHSDVKLQSELKDSDKVAITEVKVAINKLFLAISMVVDKVAPDKKDKFILELKNILKFYQSDILKPDEPKN